MENNAIYMIESRIKGLEKRLRLFQIISLLAIGMLAVFVTASFQTTTAQDKGSPDILRAKGLIIEDAQGRERVMIGAPIPQNTGRIRKDALTGIVYLGENGADQLTFGDQPDPMINGKIVPRKAPGVGVLIHNPDGTERGGFGVLDSAAILALDWTGTGEGFAASVDDKKGFAGTAIFHKKGSYNEAVTFGAISKNNESFLKITDTNDKQRLRIQTNGTEKTQLKLYDKDGKEISSKVIK